MALPLLPCEHIRACFEHLQSEVDYQPAMADLVEYVKETWIDSSVWPISSWSVFGKSIRTNNDVQGWHTRMNVDKAQVNFSKQLISLLSLKKLSKISYNSLL